MQVLAGPQTDSLRVALRSENCLCPWAVDLLKSSKARALSLRSSPATSSVDIATRWPSPSEYNDAHPVDEVSEFGQVFQVWNSGTVQVLPKIARGPVLADLTTDKNGPGFLRIRGGNPTKRYPYAVVLDLSSAWLWRHKTPHFAVRRAIKFWVDCGILTDDAQIAIESGHGHRVTRCDIAVDHLVEPGWLPEDYAYFSTRAHQIGFEAGVPVKRDDLAAPDTPPASCVFGPRSFTLYLGKRGGKGPMWRIYDKTAQLAATRPKGAESAWFWNPITEVWSASGWNRKAKVWRCEAELPAGYLHQLDAGAGRMSNIAYLNVERLWSHLTETTRHTDQDTGRARDRVTSARWAMLAAAAADHPPLESLPPRPSVDSPDLAAVFAAVRAAVALGAPNDAIYEEINRGFDEGFKREDQLRRRRQRLAATDATHEEAEVTRAKAAKFDRLRGV